MEDSAVREQSSTVSGRAGAWLGIGALVLVGLAAVPWLTSRTDLLNLLFLVFLSICLGQSWNILGGFAGQVNLGHAAFFGIGALVARNLWAVQGYPFSLAFAAGG